MAYVVDLILILQAAFQISLQDWLEGKVAKENINEIVYVFHCSEMKKAIHDEVRALVKAQCLANMVDEVELLVKKNEVRMSLSMNSMLITCYIADDKGS